MDVGCRRERRGRLFASGVTVGKAWSMEAERFAPSWHAAVERANFDFYEPDTGQYRWAGSFAGDGTQIGVCGLVDEHTVRVETSAGERKLTDDIINRLSIDELVSRDLSSQTGDVTLPYEVTVERDDRHVMVGSESYPCEGMRVAGESHWIGSLMIGDVRVRITTSSPERALAVRACIDGKSLTRKPPKTS